MVSWPQRLSGPSPGQEAISRKGEGEERKEERVLSFFLESELEAEQQLVNSAPMKREESEREKERDEKRKLFEEDEEGKGRKYQLL